MLDQIKQESQMLKKEVTEKAMTFIITAFGLVAGLAWNEAIKGLIEYLFPLGQNNLWMKFIYAFGVTIIMTLATVYMMRWLKKGEQK
jgi:hypothetical protein